VTDSDWFMSDDSECDQDKNDSDWVTDSDWFMSDDSECDQDKNDSDWVTDSDWVIVMTASVMMIKMIVTV
jgi:hypothetical protein